MSISEKQLAANRANAQKSTGPVTPEGIAVAARNATRHGLYSRDAILNSAHIKENPEEYDQLLESLRCDLQPETPLQEFLVVKIANSLWRSRRVAHAETAQVNRQLGFCAKDIPPQEAPDLASLNDPNLSPEQNQYLNIEVGPRLIPNESFNSNALRYEMRLDRQLIQLHKMYFRLKRWHDKVSGKSVRKRGKNCRETNPFDMDKLKDNQEIKIIEFGG